MEEDRWADLVRRMKETGMFREDRMDPRFVASNYYAGRAVLRGPNPSRRGTPARIEAYTALVKTRDPNWFEIALMYVDEKLQGNGVAKGLLTEVRTKKPGAKFFLISRDPAVWALARGAGFDPVTKRFFPEVEDWAKRLGLGEWLPDTALRDTVPRLNREERWLFRKK